MKRKDEYQVQVAEMGLFPVMAGSYKEAALIVIRGMVVDPSWRIKVWSQTDIDNERSPVEWDAYELGVEESE